MGRGGWVREVYVWDGIPGFDCLRLGLRVEWTGRD